MSIGPMGMIGSAAGSQLAQTSGSDVEKRADDAAKQSADTKASRKTEQAAVGEAEQDQGTGDRDADGRKIWEKQQKSTEENTEAPAEQSNQENLQSKDASGLRGNQLDLSG